MIILKVILKAMVLSVLMIVTLGQWVGVFFTGIVSVIFNLLSGLFWVMAILGYMMGVCTGAETIQYLSIAFVVFLVPNLCAWLTEVIVAFRVLLGEFIRS